MKSLAILALIILIVLLTSLVSVTPISPKDTEITKVQPTFSWSGKADYLVIDDNPEFSSPIVEKVSGSEHTIQNSLTFGTHYWKLKGIVTSKTSQFTINSVVDLEISKTGDEGKIILANSGNSALKIFHYESRGLSKLTGLHSLKINESKIVRINSKSIFVARQDE
ncbi:MAG TPA: hypothetical protein VI564_05320 [Candidatus Nanoarchaeia archaeon]|nr:hypothetical protein [Candidatus Nanoarchaeia archaeon]